MVLILCKALLRDDTREVEAYKYFETLNVDFITRLISNDCVDFGFIIGE